MIRRSKKQTQIVNFIFEIAHIAIGGWVNQLNDQKSTIIVKFIMFSKILKKIFNKQTKILIKIFYSL